MTEEPHGGKPAGSPGGTGFAVEQESLRDKCWSDLYGAIW
jgi:hypothetical protein